MSVRSWTSSLARLWLVTSQKRQISFCRRCSAQQQLASTPRLTSSKSSEGVPPRTMAQLPVTMAKPINSEKWKLKLPRSSKLRKKSANVLNKKPVARKRRKLTDVDRRKNSSVSRRKRQSALVKQKKNKCACNRCTNKSSNSVSNKCNSS